MRLAHALLDEQKLRGGRFDSISEFSGVVRKVFPCEPVEDKTTKEWIDVDAEHLIYGNIYIYIDNKSNHYDARILYGLTPCTGHVRKGCCGCRAILVAVGAIVALVTVSAGFKRPAWVQESYKTWW